MKESTTYQYILDEGRMDAFQKMLLFMGRERFGPPNEPTTTAIRGITDLERLERMVKKVLAASSWQDLLDTP